MMTGTSKIAIAAALLLLAASAWAQTVTPPNAVGSGSSISPGTLTCPAGSNCNLGQYNVNNEINPASAPYVANPRTSAVTSVTATTTASSPVVALSSTNGFVNGEGIAIYGAGPNCNINSTDCGSITVTTPTVTQTGYTGAASGATVTYQYQVSACDANYGCTAASTASPAVNGPAVLSHPNTANGTGANNTGGNSE